ncbi:hypothetical protein FACS189461_4660 [Spirochaetia bacterium]|nr:hypothetical protein FACS189461_4660 [Spirochaetia bacterium]
MRKIVAVFLLFVSFNLFAQKQNIGTITWEFRDNENISKNASSYSWNSTPGELEIHVSTTVPRKYFNDPRDSTSYFESYRNAWVISPIIINDFVATVRFNPQPGTQLINFVRDRHP